MWRWYKEAQDCYVSLLDFSMSPDMQGMQEEGMRHDRQASHGQLSDVRWLTRGRTLQKLLVLKNMLFCNNPWAVVAGKSSIGAELFDITHIPLVFLNGTYASKYGKLCSVAMRMSWIPQRQTSKLEDVAYCMLGLFGSNSRTSFYFVRIVVAEGRTLHHIPPTYLWRGTKKYCAPSI